MHTSTARVNKNVRPFTQILEGTPSVSNYYGFSPLKKGDLLPVIKHPASQIIHPGSSIQENLPKDITPVELAALGNGKRPLVILFRPTFNHNPFGQIEFLNTLQADIQIMGGSLLIVSNAPIRDLNRQLHQFSHLWVLSDPHNSLAEKFGLFTPDNPIGDWLSGIDDNIPLPAFYVVLPNGEISFHYIDYNFRTYQGNQEDIYQQAVIRQLLTRVYQDAQFINHNRNPAFKHP